MSLFMAHKRILATSQSKGTIMDFDKVDRIHAALSATLFTVCTEVEPTPAEALTAAMRMFSHLVAALVTGPDDAAHTDVALDAAIEAHCRDAAAMAKARVLEVRGYEPFQGDAGSV
jgi:hypothetical protein